MCIFVDRCLSFCTFSFGHCVGITYLPAESVVGSNGHVSSWELEIEDTNDPPILVVFRGAPCGLWLALRDINNSYLVLYSVIHSDSLLSSNIWRYQKDNQNPQIVGQTIQWPREKGQTIQWPREKGQTIQWPREKGQTI